MPITFELDGLQELIEEAERMYGNVDVAQEAFLTAYGNEILEGQQSLVRVDTGETQRSLKVSKVKNSRCIKSVWIGDIDRKRGPIPYYLEYGVMRGGKLKKFPFMRPALYQRNEVAKQKGIAAFKGVLKGGH